jgi:tyrosine-protein kinase Etk/Wzc
LTGKTPDELYVALLKSDSVQRALDGRFNLKEHYDVSSYETLRKVLPKYIRVSSDKKSGVIGVEVDDQDAQFAANLANAHEAEVTKLLGRLSVSEAQVRRVYFEKQLQETKENLIKAEQSLRTVQEKSGVIVLDKQAEALITGAALVRSQITEREVQLKVLRTSATEQNPAVMRLTSELRALRSELTRMESAQGGVPGSAVDMPVGKLPEAAIDYVRARRELKLQETLLEAMVRQYEIAKLDEAKEGPALQQVDIALPPDRKSKPARALIVLASALVALLLTSFWVVLRRYGAVVRAKDPASAAAWRGMASAWSFKR